MPSEPTAAIDRAKVVVLYQDPKESAELVALLVEAGFEPLVSASLDELLRSVTADRFQALLLDDALVDLDVLRRVGAAAPWLPILILASLEDERLALWAVRHGAADYLTKGHLDPPLLLRALRCAAELHRTRTKVTSLSTDLRRTQDALAGHVERVDLLSSALREMHAPLVALLGHVERAGSSADGNLAELEAARATLAQVLARIATLVP
ncbi:MAG: response regulator [Deltaproteobacteria bacterium]|nr:response regulator [Deltaproteobacteria bacterium]